MKAHKGMTCSPLRPIGALSVLVCVLFLVAHSPGASQDRPATSPLAQKNLASFELVWTTLRDRHYDPTLNGVDWEAAHGKYRPLVEGARSVEEARGHIQAMIDLLGQSHMAVIPGSAVDVLEGEVPDPADDGARDQPDRDPDGAEEASDIDPNAPDGEAGFTARLTDAQKGVVIVTQVETGGGAEAAGVKPGWQVLRLGGREVAEVVGQIVEGITQRGRGKPEMYVGFVMQRRLHGKAGQKLKAAFLDETGQEREVVITYKGAPGEVTTLGLLPPVRVNFRSERIERDGMTLGYVAFNAFLDPPRLAPLLEAAMRDFAGEDPVDGVVLDLRGNMGGIVAMVPGIAGYFIAEKGVHMGTLKTRDGELKLAVFPRLVQYQGPLAVLTDACSVSAAELLAGGLQAVGRARVFGMATAGEALPAQFIRLPNGDALLFVFADYTTAVGQRLEGGGVIPDEPVAYDRQALLAGEDPMLAAAAHWVAGQAQQP